MGYDTERGRGQTLPRPVYRNGRKLVRKILYSIRLIDATGLHREQVYAAVKTEFNNSEDTVFSRTKLYDLSHAIIYTTNARHMYFTLDPEDNKYKFWLNPANPEHLRLMRQRLEIWLDG